MRSTADSSARYGDRSGTLAEPRLDVRSSEPSLSYSPLAASVIRLDGQVILGQLELLGTPLDDLAEPFLGVAGCPG